MITFILWKKAFFGKLLSSFIFFFFYFFWCFFAK